MKNLLIILTVLLLISCKTKERRRYYGKVTDKYVLTSNSGYGHYHIVFYSDSLHRKIDVGVNSQTYSNSDISRVVYFMLTEYDLSR